MEFCQLIRRRRCNDIIWMGRCGLSHRIQSRTRQRVDVMCPKKSVMSIFFKRKSAAVEDGADIYGIFFRSSPLWGTKWVFFYATLQTSAMEISWNTSNNLCRYFKYSHCGRFCILMVNGYSPLILFYVFTP